VENANHGSEQLFWMVSSSLSLEKSTALVLPEDFHPPLINLEETITPPLPKLLSYKTQKPPRWVLFLEAFPDFTAILK
jgi:hypothetical protein